MHCIGSMVHVPHGPILPFKTRSQCQYIFASTIGALMEGRIQTLFHELKNGELLPLTAGPEGVTKVKVFGQSAWVITSTGLFRYQQNEWEKLSEASFVDVCVHLGKVYAATNEDIFVYEGGKLINIEPEGGYLSSDVTMLMEDGTQLLADPVQLGPITAIASYSGTLHILRPGQLVQLSGKVVSST